MKTYMWTVDKYVNMKAIFVMSTTLTVGKIRHEKKKKKKGMYGILNHDLCDTGAVIYEL